MKKYLPYLALFLIIAPALAGNGEIVNGNGNGGREDMLHLMAQLVLQLGVIVIVARLIGLLFQHVKLPVPSVLVEVCAGIIIGPHLLGSAPLFGFPDGIFPLSEVTALPISPELYGIATIASIIMLFTAGLETDLALMLKFSVVGLVVALCGDILSFSVGAAVGMAFFGLPISDPSVLFLGVICMATSVGITARILSERRKMDSPEGVTILAAAVMDDVLSIIALTAVTSIIAVETMGIVDGGAANGASSWINSALGIGRAIFVWLGFTAAGIVFARPLSRIIKQFKSVSYIAIASLALALVLAGIFEMAGLAMVIGAYVMGLSLSKTDLTDTVRDALETLHDFFVPVFFIVMGMLVDPRVFMSREVVIFGGVYTALALCAKIFGCGIPALFLNFNRRGALRIGMGMVPRGEVALIIAGIGLSSGIIDQKFFGAGVMMALASVFIAPPFISTLFKSDTCGTRKTFDVHRTVSTPIDLNSQSLAGLLEQRVLNTFRAEGFFIHTLKVGKSNIYHLRKDNKHITLHRTNTGLEFKSDEKDVILIKTTAYETLLEINNIVSSVKDIINPANMLRDLTDTKIESKASDTRDESAFKRVLTQGCIIPRISVREKREVVEQLVDILFTEGLIKGKEERDNAVDAVMAREASMSTGMQFGIALPHARTDAVDRVIISVGLSREGVDYQSLDGLPSKIFVLILSPLSSESAHIQVLANISAKLNSEESREHLLACVTQEDIYNFFTIE